MTSSARLDELERKFEENPRRYFAPLANEYRKSGDPARAVELCQQHLPQQPGHMSGHVVLAQSLLDLGQLGEAREAFQTALDLDPENLVALRSLGDIHARQGELDTAREWYHRVLEVDPRNPDIGNAIAALDERGREVAAAAREIEAPPVPPGAGHLATQFPPPPSAPVFEIPVEGSFASGGDSPFVGLTPPSGGSVNPAPDTVSDFEVQREAELLTAGFYAEVLSGSRSDAGETVEREHEAEQEPLPEEERVAEAVDAAESDLDHLFGGLTVDALESEPKADGPVGEDPFAEVDLAATPAAPRDAIEMPDMIHAGADDLLDLEEHEAAPASAAAQDLATEEGAELPAWEFEEIHQPAATAHEAVAAERDLAADEEIDLAAAEERDLAAAEEPDASERPDLATAEEPDVAGAEVAAAEEPDLATAPLLAESAESGAAPASDETPFVTETMAELLLKQGFREQGLDIYRKLLQARPDDSRLQERVEELAAADQPQAREERGAGAPVVAEWLAGLVTARLGRSSTSEQEEKKAVGEAREDERPIVPIESLLAGPVDSQEEQAAGALTAATLSYQEDRAVSEQLLAATADDPDSLDRVLRDAEEREAQLRAGASFSFEQFFRGSGAASPASESGTSPPADVASAGQPTEPPSDEDAAAADLAEFHAWLAGLSRP